MRKHCLLVPTVFMAIAVFFSSCESDPNVFQAMTNFGGGSTVCLDMDMDQAVIDGIYLPSKRQTNDGSGFFTFSFKAPENTAYYKIYYQNESYKFADTSALAAENFYGSWEDVTVGFKPIEGEQVHDALRIVGNPRDERLYYGVDVTENYRDQKHIDSIKQGIRNSESWFKSVCEKAEHNQVSLETQLTNDALWVVEHDLNDGDFNHRWKRNPRVGEYSFLLVVCDEQGLAEIPDYIQHIGKTNENGEFVNPYGWFKTHRSQHIKTFEAERRLKTRAVLTFDRGVFVDESKAENASSDMDCDCGYNKELYQHALFEQFFSHVSHQYSLRNIPVVKDVVGDDPYTRAEYEANKNRFDASQLQMNYPVVSEHPCTTVHVAPDGTYVTLVNPASTEDNLRKESTGIRSRVGFTYGKFRGKIKFPIMLNQEHMWNGLTYAFWLIYSDNHEWNNRRPSFAGGGYIPKYDDSENPQRTPYNAYSEIDIEIVKASKYWPNEYYQYVTKHPEKYQEDATMNDEVMYCCTNWDLATPEPPKFKAGLDWIPYGSRQFETMRWYPTYKALTTRTPMQNKAFAEDYYYYEIEWRPTEIIWRLGPSPDQMEVMGYMNDEYTSIPNNQMKCIVTQEYHYSEWWPPIVWDQALIPYNKTDIEGRVYEVVIE
ncbi:MAG: hypothetical protein J6P73_04075 [Bacteroidales bacterium]|nr:hypothetical protein [Bacteroidales bacterium]